jgi:hypothetical protein
MYTTHPMIQADIMHRLMDLAKIGHTMNYPVSQIIMDLQNKISMHGVDSLTAAEAVYISTLWTEAQLRGILRL